MEGRVGAMKVRVLFVDGDRQVLARLRDGLADLDSEWDMSFAEGEEKAIEWLRAEEFDVVVADADSEGVAIYSLLTHLSDNYPQTVRVVLSEDERHLHPTSRPRGAHFCIRKPARKDQFVQVVRNAHNLHRTLWRQTHELNISDVREILVDFFTAEILHQKLRYDEIPEKIKPFISKELLDRMTPPEADFAAHGLDDELTGPAPSVREWLRRS